MNFDVQYNPATNKWEGGNIDASFCDDGLRKFVCIPSNVVHLNFSMSATPVAGWSKILLERKVTKVCFTRGTNSIMLGRMMGRFLYNTLGLNKNSSIIIWGNVTTNENNKLKFL